MESVPPVVQQLTRLLQSQPMFKLLRTMTGLELADVPLNDDDDETSEEESDNEESKVMKSRKVSMRLLFSFLGKVEGDIGRSLLTSLFAS